MRCSVPRSGVSRSAAQLRRHPHPRSSSNKLRHGRGRLAGLKASETRVTVSTRSEWRGDRVGGAAQQRVGRRSSDETRRINNYAINSWLLGAPSVSALLEVVELSKADLNAVNVCTALTQLSRLLDWKAPERGSPAERALAELAVRMTSSVETHTARSLCQGLVALSALGYRDERVYGVAQAALLPKLHSVSANQLSRLVSSLFHSGHASAELFAAMESRVSSDIDAFDVRSLSYITLAYAELGFTPAPTLFTAASLRFTNCIADFQAASLTRALHSFVLSGHRGAEFLDAVAASLTSGTHRLRPDVLVAVARSYARAGHSAPQLLAFIEAEISGSLMQGAVKLSTVATLIWSFAKGGHRPAKSTCDAVAQRVQADHHILTPSDAARLLWAFARIDFSPQPAIKALQAAILRQLNDCRDVELVNVLWACATLRLHEPELFATVGRALLLRRTQPLTPQGIAITLWAYAVMNCSPPGELCRLLRDTVKTRLEKFDSQNLANVVWACAVLDVLSPNLLRACARQLEGLPKAVRSEDLRSFYQADLALRATTHQASVVRRERRRHVVDGSFLRPIKLATAARAAWVDVQQASSNPSTTQLLPSVEDTLRRLGVSYATNSLTDDGEVMADFIVRPLPADSNSVVAVEVLTPRNFAVNAPRHKLGRTRLKERLLCSRVATVVCVPYYEWDGLRGAPKAEEEYLWAKLGMHLIGTKTTAKMEPVNVSLPPAVQICR